MIIILLTNYFKINKRQSELEFIDIDLYNDLKLFIDPYIFTKLSGNFAAVCNNLIVDFFNEVIHLIRNNDEIGAKRMLNGLKEPSETHLGLSRNSVNGKAATGKKALKLYEQLKNSRATQTGNLKDLSDCELMVEGIGKDNISDITTNIIKSELIKFTQSQCNIYGIPMKLFKILIWDFKKKIWDEKELNLPYINNKKIILVPKTIVTDKLLLSYYDFYNREILPFYENKEINACSSLVKVLQTGEKKVVKKELKKKYPINKSMVYEFINERPEYLELYKARKEVFRDLDPDEIIYKAHEKIRKSNNI